MQRSVFPTEENKMVHFKNYKNNWLLPFVVYADMECKVEQSDDENIISKHTPISIAYSSGSQPPCRGTLVCRRMIIGVLRRDFIFEFTSSDSNFQ